MIFEYNMKIYISQLNSYLYHRLDLIYLWLYGHVLQLSGGWWDLKDIKVRLLIVYKLL